MKTAAETNTCPASQILTLLSRTHMLVVLNALAKKPRGFTDLQADLKINTATLANRLRELEAAGLVEILPCTRDSRAHYYELTIRGKKISQIVVRLSSI